MKNKPFMQKVLLLCLALVWASAPVRAGDPPKYEVSKIHEALRKGAQAVVRLDEEILDVQDLGFAIQKVRYAITIFGPEADEHATRSVFYDQLTKLTRLDGRVYDQFGKEVARLRKADIVDRACFDGFTFLSDNRVKVASLARNTYPYTVEFEYEYENRNLIGYETWSAQSDPKESVEHSRMVVLLPSSVPSLRYLARNTDVQPVIDQYEGKKRYVWEWKNLLVMPKAEPYAPAVHRLPHVVIAPAKFSVAGYEGDFSSWEGLGKWNAQLNQGRDELPPATQAKVRELVANLPGQEAKVRALYEYMQSRTRYVGIQLGIGGWQPFPASEVDAKGYGDCKALSNYMRALLKVVGIESHYTLIYAGDEPWAKSNFAPEFPSRQFNHAILCVPLEQRDTVWLECTSQEQATGYMSNFTDDRHALLVTPEGGKLVRTPRYGRQHNFLHRLATVKVAADGHATAEVRTQYGGLQQDEQQMDRYAIAAPEEQKKWLYEQIKLPSFEIAAFQLARQKSRVPVVTETLSLKINALAAKSGKRLFIQPNLFSKWEHVPAEMEKRQSEVEVSRYDYVDNDTIKFQLPEGYYLEHKPEDVNVQSVFGHYKVVVKVEANTVTYIRQVSLNQGRFPKEKYQEWVEFYRQVARADKMKIVVVSTT
jgi:transglutaminase-like putative cysteine protease